jgi:ketosteroid isomerase-like protein
MTHRSAAELAEQCLTNLATKDLPRLLELFDDDAGWELAYGPDGVDDDQTIRGKGVIAKFHTTLMAVLETVEFFDIEINAVHDELAFVQCRSRITTVKGQPYSNRYVFRCDAKDGKILHWLEYFDTRPGEMLRADFAESLAGRQRR